MWWHLGVVLLYRHVFLIWPFLWATAQRRWGWGALQSMQESKRGGGKSQGARWWATQLPGLWVLKDTEERAALNMQQCKLGCREEGRGWGGLTDLFQFPCDGSPFSSEAHLFWQFSFLAPTWHFLLAISPLPNVFHTTFPGSSTPPRLAFGRQRLPPHRSADLKRLLKQTSSCGSVC